MSSYVDRGKGDHAWFHDPEYKEKLEERIATGQFFISYMSGPLQVPARVVKVIYSGFKVKLPDGQEIVHNLAQNDYVDITPEEYRALEIDFNQEMQKREEEKQRQEEVKRQKLAFQQSCRHEKLTEKQVVKAAGCDIYDVSCNICDKILRRWWSTAYENDPNDEISDWNWYLRHCVEKFGADYHPDITNYNIVQSIGPM